MPAPIIRPALQRDVPQLSQLVVQLAAQHGDTTVPDPDALMRDLFDPVPWLRGLVAAETGTLLGYALLMPHAQAQFGRRGLDLHHLFVRPDRRGTGLGRALIQASEAEAARLQCSYLVIGTDAGNTAAQDWYRGLGYAERLKGGPRFGKVLA